MQQKHSLRITFWCGEGGVLMMAGWFPCSTTCIPCMTCLWVEIICGRGSGGGGMEFFG